MKLQLGDTRKVYSCNHSTASNIQTNSVSHISVEGEQGSSCFIEGCFYIETVSTFYRTISNNCIIPGGEHVLESRCIYAAILFSV